MSSLSGIRQSQLASASSSGTGIASGYSPTGASASPSSTIMTSSVQRRRNQTIVDERFDRAVQIVQTLSKGGPIQPSYDEKLLLYSYYKQATEGNCRGSKPGLFDVLGRAKWDSWNKRRGLSPQDAKKGYVEFFLRILRRFSDDPTATTLISRLEAPPRSDDSEGSSDFSMTEDVEIEPPPYSSHVYSNTTTTQSNRRRQPTEQSNDLNTNNTSSASPPSTSSDEPILSSQQENLTSNIITSTTNQISNSNSNANANANANVNISRTLAALQIEIQTLSERMDNLSRTLKSSRKKLPKKTWIHKISNILRHASIDVIFILMILVLFSRRGNRFARMILAIVESMWISQWTKWRSSILGPSLLTSNSQFSSTQ